MIKKQIYISKNEQLKKHYGKIGWSRDYIKYIEELDMPQCQWRLDNNYNGQNQAMIYDYRLKKSIVFAAADTMEQAVIECAEKFLLLREKYENGHV